MAFVGYAFLAVTVVGALGVLNAYRPARLEPLAVPSFLVGWLVGELAIQNIVWEMAATVGFGFGGAFATWPGRVGLGIAVVGWWGLVGLALSGHRAGRVVAQALSSASGGPLRATPDPPKPSWGRWWRVTRAIPLHGRDVKVVHDVDYWGDGIRRHRLDIIKGARPSPAAGTPAPVMVYIHGGAWILGNKREQGRPMLYELAARGWVCVSMNYRISPRATWPDHVVDCKRAIAWVHEHIGAYGGDPSFIALSGGSAGGHLCALTALSADDKSWQPGFEEADTSVQACVPFYGVYDFTGEASGPGGYFSGLQRLLERMVMKQSLAENRAAFEQASPTFRVHEGAPPFFVLHGRNDTVVPVEVARRFVSALRGVSRAVVAYAELPLAQHAFDVLASLRCQATTAGVATFLTAVREDRAREDVRSRAPQAPHSSDGSGKFVTGQTS